MPVVNMGGQPRYVFPVGFASAAFLAVYWSVVVFVLRFIFGEHSFFQSGTESAVLGTGMFLAYVFGYFVPIFSPGRLVHLLNDSEGIAWTKDHAFGVIVAGLVMMFACNAINAHYSHAFTWTFWTLVYSVTVGLMLRFGIRDGQLQGLADRGVI